MQIQTYLVRPRSGTSWRPLTAEGFEDAALSYLETSHPPADAEGEVVLIVRDGDTGREQCFRLDLETGRSEPCD